MKSKRTAILEAATWLFSTKGYREASTTEVARLTDSAEGTIFYHFESKEKLFLAVLEDVKARIDAGFAEFLPTTEDLSGLEILEGLVAFYLQLAADNEEQFMLLHRHHAYDLAKVNEECRALLEAIYDRIVRSFEEAIQRGQDDGSCSAQIKSITPWWPGLRPVIIEVHAGGVKGFAVDKSCARTPD